MPEEKSPQDVGGRRAVQGRSRNREREVCGRADLIVVAVAVAVVKVAVGP